MSSGFLSEQDDSEGPDLVRMSPVRSSHQDREVGAVQEMMDIDFSGDIRVVRICIIVKVPIKVI